MLAAASAGNSNQFLHADYLSPLPSTLDTEKSPLALLAQTCNNIGAPDPPKGKDSNGTKSSSLSSSSSSDKSSPTSNNTKSSQSIRRSNSKSPTGDKRAPTALFDDMSKKRSPNNMQMPHSTALPLNMSGLAGAALNNPAALFGGTNPFLNASNAKPLPLSGSFPHCRDPMCFQCPMGFAHGSSSLPVSGASPVFPPPGIDFNSHPNYAALAAMAASLSGAAGSAFPSMANSAALTSGKPFVCNWYTLGDGYCGKRYSNSDDLFSHLRTHTSVGLSMSSLPSDPLQAAYASYAQSLRLNPQLAQLAHLQQQQQQQQSAPGALSVSAASSSSRFHPYSKPVNAQNALGANALPPAVSSSASLPLGWPTSLSAAFPGLYPPTAFSSLYPRPPFG